MIKNDVSNWWRGAVIYQIYPRSFLDSNNDGIGDLAGITQKLNYISDLGVNGIWISPFFTSPMKDFGYDVSNYRDIDPIFGTLQDFDELLKKAHDLGLKIIVDLVLSHTSDQHPWFCDEAKKSWYIWSNANIDKHGNKSPPNNWVSVFGGSAWEWDEQREQYYFHNFLKEQPDLNFHNKQVQAEMLDICKFWFDRGVDGFRLDTVNFYFHDLKLRDNPPRNNSLGYATQFEGDTPYSRQQHIHDKSQPENMLFIKKLRNLADSYPNRVLIGEIGDDHPYKLAKTYTSGKNLLHTAYNPHMMSGKHKDLTPDLILGPIKEFFDITENSPDDNYQSWPSWAFSNHDVVRAASRWYKEFDHDPKLSKMLIALLGCLPGTVFLYQGEELGLPEAEIPYKKLQDPWAKQTWPIWQGRDGCRTPMPWDESVNCGFSGHESTWLPIPYSHNNLNVRSQHADKSSILQFTRNFIHWRANRTEITNGNHEVNAVSNSKIIEIRRWNDKNETFCIFNLSSSTQNYKGNKISGFSFIIDGFKY